MASNSDPIVQQVQQDFQTLLSYVTGPEARTQTAYSVELTLFRRVLALGALLLQVFFVTRATERPADPVTADGTRLTYRDRRCVTYFSVFGKVAFARHYFSAPGHGGVCPLDEALSLPARCYSMRLSEWASYATTDSAYRESQTVLQRILGLTLSVQALETLTADGATDVTTFYTEPPAATRPTDATILVVTADGKGVPMVQPTDGARRVRLRKGQKHTRKKEAVVTALYTIAPYERTPQDIVAALLADEGAAASPPRPRPTPVDKEVHATLAGKEVALARLAERAAQRDGPSIQDRVALTDGAEALQLQMHTHCPAYTLVLDIIHAIEYLWDSANAVLGESHPDRTAWVRQQLEQVLTGQTQAVITALETAANAPDCTASQRQVLKRTLGYYQRNQPYMRYDEYLARGWPIGTGVIEGACGHLVKDRMEQAGMRWTQAGAQAVLDLRAVRLNQHWDAYWHVHRAAQHRRVYGLATAEPPVAELQLLEDAA